MSKTQEYILIGKHYVSVPNKVKGEPPTVQCLEPGTVIELTEERAANLVGKVELFKPQKAKGKAKLKGGNGPKAASSEKPKGGEKAEAV